MRAATGAALALFLAAGFGCATYRNTSQATKDLWSVRVVQDAADVKNCRSLGLVDATDSARGCGLTVQPSTQECLRYQVALAGGDTLVDRGFVGDAYDCSSRETASKAPSPVPAPSSTPTPTPPPTPSPARPVPSPAPSPRATPQPSATPAPTQTAVAPLATPSPTSTPAPAGGSGVRIVESRSALKGCVYLDEIDLKTACPAGDAAASIECLLARASRIGGDAVLVEQNRAMVFSCKNGP